MPIIFSQVNTTATDTSMSDLEQACGADPGNACDWVYGITSNEFLADTAQWLTGRPSRIILILLGALIFGIITRRGIRHFAEKLTDETTGNQIKGVRDNAKKYMALKERMNKRAIARTKTIASVLSSVAFALIWGVAFMIILGELNINIGPLIAGAGVAGFAIGFGAQSIVKDFMSGVFMLIEDQFGVGDIIDSGFAIGKVEKVSLRTTTLRDNTGTVWHIPNGEIHRVANKSQLWAKALLEIDVAYSTDLRLAEGVIQRVADEMWNDPEWGGDEILEKPEVHGIQNLGADGISIRLVVKTEPATQWSVERELRIRIKEAFDEAGIEIPFPQRTIWIRDEGDHPPIKKPDPKTITTAPVSRYIKDIEESILDEEEIEIEVEEEPESKKPRWRKRL